MDGIANVAKQQQTQMLSQEQMSNNTTERAVEQSHQAQIRKDDVVEQMQDSFSDEKKINSQKDVEDLVEKLNDAIAPMHTTLRFGVDRDDVFYVSVIDLKTDRMIRRFPAEKGAEFLPKMKEVSGMLFDSKG